MCRARDFGDARAQGIRQVWCVGHIVIEGDVLLEAGEVIAGEAARAPGEFTNSVAWSFEDTDDGGNFVGMRGGAGRNGDARVEVAAGEICAEDALAVGFKLRGLKGATAEKPAVARCAV